MTAAVGREELERVGDLHTSSEFATQDVEAIMAGAPGARRAPAGAS